MAWLAAGEVFGGRTDRVGEIDHFLVDVELFEGECHRLLGNERRE